LSYDVFVVGVKATSPRGEALGEFGEKFRKEREKKNFSLDDVAGVTKIGVRMLRAIEEENFDRLPGGVFNKGFIRTYAKHLGMNDEKAVADYLACIRKTQLGPDAPAELVAATPTRPSAEKRTPSAPKKKSAAQPHSKAQTAIQVEELPDLQLPRAEHARPPGKKYLGDRDSGIPLRLVAAAALVVVLALFLWNRHSRNARAEASAPQRPVPTAQSIPATSPAPSPSLSAASHSNEAVAGHSPSSTQPSSVVPSPMALRSAAASTAATISQPAGAPNAVAPAASVPAASLTLIIRASENSWISVRADGQEVTQETLIAPAHTSVRATREIIVKTGNAAGINFLWNGKEVPAQGTEAEVRTLTFDAEGVHANVPTQPAAQNQ
jgi:cytoskeleton protein RodZ